MKIELWLRLSSNFLDFLNSNYKNKTHIQRWKWISCPQVWIHEWVMLTLNICQNPSLASLCGVGVVHTCTCTRACSSLICAKYSLQPTQRNHTLIKTILIQVKLLSINLFPHTMNVLIIIQSYLLVYNARSIFNYYSTQGRHALYLMEHLTLFSLK